MSVVEVLRDTLSEIFVRNGNEAANVIRIVAHDSAVNLEDVHVLMLGKG